MCGLILLKYGELINDLPQTEGGLAHYKAVAKLLRSNYDFRECWLKSESKIQTWLEKLKDNDISDEQASRIFEQAEKDIDSCTVNMQYFIKNEEFLDHLFSRK